MIKYEIDKEEQQKQLRNWRFWAIIPLCVLLAILAIILECVSIFALVAKNVETVCRRFEYRICRSILTPIMEWKDRGIL